MKKLLLLSLVALGVAVHIQSGITAQKFASGGKKAAKITKETPKRPDATKLKAPPYITSNKGRPVMQVAVLNRTKRVSKSLLDRVLKIVTKQVKEDFSPFYGIEVAFQVFEDEEQVNWHKHAALVIPNFLLVDIPGVIALHDFQDSTGAQGDPISLLISDPPALPNGTPYALVPMGNAKTDYGVVPAHLSHDPTLPPTFAGLLCNSVSHEVLEMLYDYVTDDTKSFFNIVRHKTKSVDFFSGEVCDPVEFNPGYLFCGLSVSNFVLPSYWVPGLKKGPFDFLNTVPAPLTPFTGEQDYYKAGCTGLELFSRVSLPRPFGNPNRVHVVDLGSVLSCPSPAASSITNNGHMRVRRTVAQIAKHVEQQKTVQN